MTELAKWRRAKGWSQQRVARDLGYGKKWTTYAAQERGDNPMPTAGTEKLRAWGYSGPMPQEEGGPVSDSLAKEMIEVRAALKAHLEQWNHGEEKVLRRLEELGQRIAVLEDRAGVRR